MYFNRKCKVTFICHGATIYSEENRFSHIENYPPLSEAGFDEIERICGYLKARGIKNNVIYTSPALRTVQSAKIISKIYKTDYTIVENLKPRCCGKLNSLTLEQVEEKNLGCLKKWFVDIDYDEDLQAESIKDFVEHTSNTLNKIIEENAGNRIIIVTYPEVIQAAICAALDMPLATMSKIFIRTGSATQISYFDNWASLMYSDYKPLGN